MLHCLGLTVSVYGVYKECIQPSKTKLVVTILQLVVTYQTTKKKVAVRSYLVVLVREKLNNDIVALVLLKLKKSHDFRSILLTPKHFCKNL